MKRFVILALGLLLVSPNLLAKVKVFACEPEWKSLVEELGGRHVKAYTATTAFQDPHYIEARPSLIAKTRRSDLLVCTGADLEVGWLPLLLRQSGNAKIQVGEEGYFLAADHVETIEKPTQVDRSMGDIHAAGNPHVHWDPYRLMTIAKALSERLQRIDPDHASDYQQQLEQFLESWKTSIARWEALAARLEGKKVIVNHKTWSYLLNWLKVDVVGDIEPKPGIPATSTHLAQLLKSARNEKPDYILMTNYQDEKGARWLSDKLSIPVLKLPNTIGGEKQASDLIALYDFVLSSLK